MPGGQPVRTGPREHEDLRPENWYILPDALRRDLAAPFGPVYSSEELAKALKPDDFLLAVGDVVSLTLKQLGRTPRLFVCDYLTQRGEVDPTFELELGSWGEVSFNVRNPAGTITRQAWDAVKAGLWHTPSPVRILVDGEEDLLAIPCFLEAPVGARVLYGLPGKGVVMVEVTSAFHARVASLLARFIKE